MVYLISKHSTNKNTGIFNSNIEAIVSTINVARKYIELKYPSAFPTCDYQNYQLLTEDEYAKFYIVPIEVIQENHDIFHENTNF